MSTAVQQRSTKKRRPHTVIALLIALLSLAAMLYPVVGTLQRNAEQASQAQTYHDTQVTTDEVTRQYWMDQARAYTVSNTGAPILDPWLNRVAKDNAPYQEYLQQLNPSGEDNAIIAALDIPSIDARLPIYHGTDDFALQNGVGHLYGSALPIGGEGTHSVLTAHTGLTTATLFDRLDEVQLDEAFYINVMGELLKYEVTSIDVVLPDEVESLQPVPGQDLVTLITCTPYGVNSHRLLVRGERVPLDPVDEQEAFDGKGSIWQPWMTWVLLIVLAVLLVIAWLVWRSRRQARQTESTEANI